MNKECIARSLLAVLVMLSSVSFTGIAFAQDQSIQHPMFVHPTPHFDPAAPPATPLQTWNGTFTYQGHTYTFTMVGTDPSSTNTSTTVNAYIIPVRAVFKKNGTTIVF